MKLSVIIPVYNTEQYLYQCIDSVLSQSFSDFELILVDDGSTDRSGIICDQCAEKDQRVRVIHKRNGGLSDARNAGISVARGECGLFVDSDDYWTDSKTLEKLVKRYTLSHADVINFSYRKVDDETGQVSSMLCCEQDMPLEYISIEQQLDFLSSHSLLVSSAWNKMISMKVLKQTLFEMERISEDVEWCMRLIVNANSFDYINGELYCYRQRNHSIAHSISEKSCKDLAYAVRKCCLIVKDMPVSRTEYGAIYAAYQFSTFIAVQAFAPSFQKQCIREMDRYTYILENYHNNRKVKIMYFGVRVFGLNKWCWLIRATKGIWDSRRDWI